MAARTNGPATVMPGKPLKWEFWSSGQQFSVSWSWKSMDDHRTVRESTATFSSLPEALADARKHGFNDARDHYSIY